MPDPLAASLRLPDFKGHRLHPRADCFDNVVVFCTGSFNNGLTARQAGFRPAWALGSAGAIAAFPVLIGIEAVTFLAEHDDGGANRRAIERCAQTYLVAGCEVWVIDPPRGDLNDFHKGRAA